MVGVCLPASVSTRTAARRVDPACSRGDRHPLEAQRQQGPRRLSIGRVVEDSARPAKRLMDGNVSGDDAKFDLAKPLGDADKAALPM